MYSFWSCMWLNWANKSKTFKRQLKMTNGTDLLCVHAYKNKQMFARWKPAEAPMYVICIVRIHVFFPATNLFLHL